MEEFALKHPWVTFIGGILVLNTVSWTAWMASLSARRSKAAVATTTP
jgi:hypothetical protein